MKHMTNVQRIQFLIQWTAPRYGHPNRCEAMHDDGMSWAEIYRQLEKERGFLASAEQRDKDDGTTNY